MRDACQLPDGTTTYWACGLAWDLYCEVRDGMFIRRAGKGRVQHIQSGRRGRRGVERVCEVAAFEREHVGDFNGGPGDRRGRLGRGVLVHPQIGEPPPAGHRWRVVRIADARSYRRGGHPSPSPPSIAALP